MDDKLKAEHWLFVLFVFTLPFAVPFSIFGAPVQLSDLVFLSAAIVWAIKLVLKRATLQWNWFYLCLGAYAVAVILSTITSVDPTSSSIKLAGKFLLIGTAFLTVNILSSLPVLKKVMQAWLVGSGVVLLCSLLGIVLFYAGWQDASQNIVVHKSFGSLPPGNYPSIEGFFAYPATLCNFLAVTWMFALSVSSECQKKLQFWLFAAALFIVDAFTLTPGLGGIFLVTGYFLQQKLKSGSAHIVGRSAFVTGMLIAAAFLIVTSVELFPYKADGSAFTEWELRPSVRVEAWRTSLETFVHDPLLGRGVGMPIADAGFTASSGEYHLLTDAHNTYLSVLGETGLVGFVTFMSIVCFAAVSMFRWKPASDLFKTISLCLLLALVDAFLYQSLTGSYEDARYLWVLFGMAVAVGRTSDDAYAAKCLLRP